MADTGPDAQADTDTDVDPLATPWHRTPSQATTSHAMRDARTHDDVQVHGRDTDRDVLADRHRRGLTRHATAHNAKPSHAKPRHSDAARYRATPHRDVELEKGFVRLWFDFTLFSVGMRASVAVRYTFGWLTLVVFLAVSLWWRVSCPLIVFLFVCVCG